MINKFFKEIQDKKAISKVYEDKYSKALALDFNPLDFVTWNENKVSALLAYFLTPSAGHQQGATYLKIFVETLEIPFLYNDENNIKVKTEDSTYTNRRVDIVISSNEYDQVIGIENKIDTRTADQENQLKDYYDYLQTVSKSENLTLIYLAPKDKKIPQYDTNDLENSEFNSLIEARKILLISYEEHIIPMLKQFVLVTENNRVRNFLDDFTRKLMENYFGKQNLNNNMIQNHIIESTTNIRTAFEVSNSLKQVKETLKTNLNEQMDAIAKKYGGIYNKEHRHFEFSKLKNTYIKFNYEMGGVIYGIVKRPAFEIQNKEKLNFSELMAHLGGKFSTSHWWPLYQLKYRGIDINPEFWIAIAEKEFKQFMDDFIREILHAPEEITKGL